MLITLKHQRSGDYTHLSITDGKKTVDITKGPHGVDVCMQNSMHQVWRGMGKRFDSFSSAAAAYKSPFMRRAIEYAGDQVTEAEKTRRDQ
jgi:hypothetical protein